MKINLAEFSGRKGSAFTGRPQGRDVRKELNLDKIEDKESSITIIIPDGTTAFNPSFFLGLLYKSIEKLGSVEKFLEKFSFENQIKDDDYKRLVNEDIQEGIRYAKNDLNNISGLNRWK